MTEEGAVQHQGRRIPGIDQRARKLINLTEAQSCFGRWKRVKTVSKVES